MSDQIELAADLRTWIDALRRATAERDRWAEIADQCRTNIQQAMGEAETATIGGRPVARWTTVQRSTVDTRRLRAELPDVAAQYTRTSSSRRFTLVEEESTDG